MTHPLKGKPSNNPNGRKPLPDGAAKKRRFPMLTDADWHKAEEIGRQETGKRNGSAGIAIALREYEVE